MDKIDIIGQKQTKIYQIDQNGQICNYGLNWLNLTENEFKFDQNRKSWKFSVKIDQVDRIAKFQNWQIHSILKNISGQVTWGMSSKIVKAVIYRNCSRFTSFSWFAARQQCNATTSLMYLLAKKCTWNLLWVQNVLVPCKQAPILDCIHLRVLHFPPAPLKCLWKVEKLTIWHWPHLHFRHPKPNLGSETFECRSIIYTFMWMEYWQNRLSFENRKTV